MPKIGYILILILNKPNYLIIFLTKWMSCWAYRLDPITGSQNKVADALSKRSILLNAMQVKVIGFEILKEQHAKDLDFGRIWFD